MEENGLALLKATLENGGFTCVIYKDNQILTSKEKGIRPIIGWLRSDFGALKNAFAADKIVGKAAAMLFVYGGVSDLYASVISRQALAFLKDSPVNVTFGKLVDSIKNLEGSDMCPMEKRALHLSDPKAAYEMFDALIKA